MKFNNNHRHAFQSLLVVLVFLLFPPATIASNQSSSFLQGERLEYHLSYFKINAGSAVLKVEENKRDKNNSIIITSVARSNKFFSMFFKVVDRIETIVNRKKLYPYTLNIDQQEGLRRKKKHIFFDHQNSTVLVRDFKNQKIKEKNFYLEPFSHNSLSAFYYLRTIKDLKNGDSVVLNVHEGGKNWKLEIDVLKRETINISLGEFDAIKLKARVMFEGVFMDKGDVYIWVTDDDLKVPLKLYFNISFGKVVADLVKIN